MGLIDSNDEVILDFDYNFIGPPSETVAVIGKGGKYGVVGMNGEIATTIQYDRIELRNNEAKAFKGNALSVLVYNEDGVQQEEDHFKNFGTLKISSKGSKQKIKRRLLDKSENPYLLENFEWFFHEETELWGLRDRNTGKTKIPHYLP